jgi:putative membrane protein
MILYNPKSWFKHIFNFAKSDTLYILWKELLALAIVTLGITYLELNHMKRIDFLTNMIAVYSLIGFVLSLLLVFRTNTAYDRWWEGRKKWGELVNNSRNLAIKISASVTNEEDRAFFVRMISNYSIALKEHLRKGVTAEMLDLTTEEILLFNDTIHIPNLITKWMYDRLKKCRKEGQIDDMDYLTIDKNLNSFNDITGACERIKNTPIPYSYSLFLKKFIFIYVVTLPMAFVPTFGYGTVLIACFIFYVLVSIEILAEEIEDPFGKDDNDLPTDSLSLKIGDNVKEILRS